MSVNIRVPFYERLTEDLAFNYDGHGVALLQMNIKIREFTGVICLINQKKKTPLTGISKPNEPALKRKPLGTEAIKPTDPRFKSPDELLSNFLKKKPKEEVKEEIGGIIDENVEIVQNNFQAEQAAFEEAPIQPEPTPAFSEKDDFAPPQIKISIKQKEETPLHPQPTPASPYELMRKFESKEGSFESISPKNEIEELKAQHQKEINKWLQYNEKINQWKEAVTKNMSLVMEDLLELKILRTEVKSLKEELRIKDAELNEHQKSEAKPSKMGSLLKLLNRHAE